MPNVTDVRVRAGISHEEDLSLLNKISTKCLVFPIGIFKCRIYGILHPWQALPIDTKITEAIHECS